MRRFLRETLLNPGNYNKSHLPANSGGGLALNPEQNASVYSTSLFCPHCGAKLDPNPNYCGNCGKRL